MENLNAAKEGAQCAVCNDTSFASLTASILDDDSMSRFLAVLIAVNSAWFATMHVCWALGWRWGIPASMPSVNERPWFLAYDVAAAVLMAGLAAAAAHIARCPSRAAQGWWRLVLIATVVLCAARGVPGLVGDGIAAVQGSLTAVSALADVWFVTTAALAAGVILTAPRWEPVATR